MKFLFCHEHDQMFHKGFQTMAMVRQVLNCCPYFTVYYCFLKRMLEFVCPLVKRTKFR